MEATTTGDWQNRIIGSGTEDPEQLLANPRNWRIHPGEQQDRLKALLEKVGWVQNIIVNQRTGHVVDGHLRVGVAISEGRSQVPVVYVDLDEDEEAAVLAMLDPLAAMAATDEGALVGLLSDLQNPDLDELARSVHALKGQGGQAPSAGDIAKAAQDLKDQFDKAGADDPGKHTSVTCPNCGHDFAIGGMNAPDPS
jgi:ParB-like chromosome segregation protein Spo0J